MGYAIVFDTNIDFVDFMWDLVYKYNGITGVLGKIKYMSSGTMSALTTKNMNTFKSWCPGAWENGRVEAHIKPFLDKPGYFGADCNNMYKSIFWGLNLNKVDEIDKYTPNGPGVVRNSNGLKDLGADDLFEICTDIDDDMTVIIPGEMVWMKGHIGMYYGKIDGVDYVIDVTISQGGLALNKMSNQRWTHHGKCPFIGKYIVDEPIDCVQYFNSCIGMKRGDNGEKVSHLQAGLNDVNKILNLDFVPLVVDGKYGSKTEALVERVKEIYFIKEDGAGIITLGLIATIKSMT